MAPLIGWDGVQHYSEVPIEGSDTGHRYFRFRFLNEAFYLERAAAFLSYNPRSWVSTILLTVSRFSMVPWSLITMLSAVLQWRREWLIEAEIPELPFIVVGSALGFVMVFRINNAYARWWEGRHVWAQIGSLCNTAAAHATAAFPPSYLPGFVAELLMFVVALKNALRGVATRREELCRVEDGGMITHDALDALNDAHSPPLAALEALEHTVRMALQESGGPLAGSSYMHMQNLLQTLSMSAAACERINFSLMPHGYVATLRWFLLSWLSALPFGLVGSLGWAAMFACSLVALLYLSLEEIAMQVSVGDLF